MTGSHWPCGTPKGDGGRGDEADDQGRALQPGDLGAAVHVATDHRLVSVEHDYDPYSGIPRMSAIPVAIRRAETSTG